jgi:hypothetical protein
MDIEEIQANIADNVGGAEEIVEHLRNAESCENAHDLKVNLEKAVTDLFQLVLATKENLEYTKILIRRSK